MNRIGVDLAKLVAGEPLPDDFVPACPGARVRVMRVDLDDMIRRGERFRTNRNDLPRDGYGDARVLCSNEVAPLVGTASKARLYYGLCHSCSTAESDNRATLRERQGVQDRNRRAAE